MLDEVERHLDAIRAWAEELEPDGCDPDQARVVLGFAAAMERLGAGLKVLMARRAVLGAPYKEEGHRSAASWLAEQTRTSVPEAISTLATAEQLANLPAASRAVRRGALSALEVRTLSTAATADPSAEEALLEAAGSLSLRGFVGQARRMAAVAHEHDPGHRTEVHRNRYVRWWTDAAGSLRLSGALTPDAGADLVNCVRSRAAHMADEAARAGISGESQAAYDADALVSLVMGEERWATFDGPQGGRRRRPDVVFHVSRAALGRGSLEDGELCEIPGVGQVPLLVAENVLGDATARLVISDGVDVTTVCHMGRTVPAHVETALEARDRTCVVPGCEVSLNLEIDHWKIPFARGGATELWNLARLCRLHHRMKTFEGYLLRGGPGKWEWLPPD